MVEKTIAIRLVGDASGFVAAVSASGAATASMGKQVAIAAGTANSALLSFGKTAVKVGKFTILGVAAGLALSAKAAIDFESSFAGVRKTVETSEAGFAILEDSIRGIALQIPIAVDELNQIAELGGQLGVGANALPEFTKTIAELGVTTVLSTEEAALGFARLDNIMQLNQRSFRQMGSTVVDLGNNFASTEDEILNFALRIAPVGKVANLSAGEILGIGTAFASVGVKAERGGTSVQKALISITEAAQMGGEKLQTFADVAGLSAKEFKNLVDTDPARAFSTFITGLKRVTLEGQNVFDILRSVGLGNTRVTQSLLAVAQAGGLIEDTLAAQEAAWENNTALTEEAGKRFETTASKIKLAVNQMKDMAITIGQTVIPKLGAFAEGLGDFLRGITLLPEPIKAVSKALLGLSVATGIGGVAISGISKIMGGSLIAKLGLGAVAAGGLATAIGVGLVVAVGLVTRKVAESGRQQRETKIRVDSLTEALKLQAQGYKDAGREAIKNRIISEGALPSLTRLGIGLNDFVDAIFRDENALSKVNERLEDTKDRYDAILSSPPVKFGDDRTREETIAEGERLTQMWDDLIFIQEVLGVSSTDLAISQQGLLEMSSQLADSIDIERGGQLYGSVLSQAEQSTVDFEAVLEDLNATAGLTPENIEDISTAVGEYADAFTTSFEDTRGSILDQVSAWNDLGAAVIFNVDKILASRAEQVKIVSEFEQVVSGLNVDAATLSEIRDDFGDTLENQRDFVALANANPEAFTKLVEGYRDSVKEMSKAAFKTYFKDIPDIIAKSGPEMFAALGSIVDEIVADDALNPADAWIQVITEALEAAPPELRLLMEETIREGIMALGPDTAPIGDDIITGIVEGINRSKSILVGAMGGLADLIVGTTRSKLQMQSPSKIFADIGRNVVDGFVSGLNDNMDKLSGFGPQVLGIPNRHQLVGGSTTSTENSTSNNFNLNVNGSTNVSDDAKAILLAAQVIGAI